MCMMCEEDAIYYAYLEWKAQKERDEAAAAAAAPADTSQPASPQAVPDQPESSVTKPSFAKQSFTCD